MQGNAIIVEILSLHLNYFIEMIFQEYWFYIVYSLVLQWKQNEEIFVLQYWCNIHGFPKITFVNVQLIRSCLIKDIDHFHEFVSSNMKPS